MGEINRENKSDLEAINIVFGWSLSDSFENKSI